MNNRAGEIVKAAKTIIENEYPHLESIEALAESLEIGQYHLIRVFKKETGYTPNEYLINIRLLSSKYLLSKTDYTLDMIAGLSGFACGNYLCKVFKKHNNMTPLEFREKCSTGEIKLETKFKSQDDIFFV